jgi:hypothetical protein
MQEQPKNAYEYCNQYNYRHQWKHQYERHLEVGQAEEE